MRDGADEVEGPDLSGPTVRVWGTAWVRWRGRPCPAPTSG